MPLLDPDSPRLDPILQALPDAARLFWSSAAQRRQAFEAALVAWEQGDPALDSLLARIDGAITHGLAQLGLPRGPIRGIRLEGGYPHLVGAKLPDCFLLLGPEGMREWVTARRQPDYVFRTWVHESLHGRQPIGPMAKMEHRTMEGYEEGLVEGLSRLIVQRAGIHLTDMPYTYYVRAYEALADAVSIDVEILWRELWRSPMGGVRVTFVAAVADLHQRVTNDALSSMQRARLQGIADTVFSSTRRLWSPNRDELERGWRLAFI